MAGSGRLHPDGHGQREALAATQDFPARVDACRRLPYKGRVMAIRRDHSTDWKHDLQPVPTWGAGEGCRGR